MLIQAAVKIMKTHCMFCLISAKQFCLIPITAHTLAEKEAIKMFVSKYKDDATLMAHLSSSLLSYDVRRHLRGYIITDPNTKGRYSTNL